MIQITQKGQQHMRKIVDRYLPLERIDLDKIFKAKGVDTKELTDDELYSMCEEKGMTDHIWYSLATIWDI